MAQREAGPAALVGRSVVVTGNTRGFGLALTRLLASLGMRVVVSSPFPGEHEAVAAELSADGATAVAAPGDVTDPAQVAGLVDTAVTAYGSLDVWVNNAAFATPGMARMLEIPDDVFAAITEVNVLGTYRGTRAALQQMVEQRRGLIVNVTGRGDDVRPSRYTSAYAASKAWIRSFTRTVEAEYADSGVSVVAFNPGMMRTDRLSTEATDSVAADHRTMQLYEVVTRALADPPEVAAQRLAQLIAAAQVGPVKSELRLITPSRLARGAASELRRAATRNRP